MIRTTCKLARCGEIGGVALRSRMEWLRTYSGHGSIQRPTTAIKLCHEATSRGSRTPTKRCSPYRGELGSFPQPMASDIGRSVGKKSG